MPVLSSEVKRRRKLKILVWGDTGSRKSETITRYFPHVYLVDTEGNADQMLGMAAIPPFYLDQTKDTLRIIDELDKATAKKYKFSDGVPVETFGIDSVSVLWNIGSDTAALSAEKRAERNNQAVEDATLTQLDWGKGKRHLKRLHTKLANCDIPFIVMTAREADLYDETSKNPKKIGVRPEVMKGLIYEVNIAFHFYYEGAQWVCEVTKVQGALGELLPKGSKHKTFPIDKLLAYSSNLVAGTGHLEDDEKMAEKLAGEEDRSWNGLLKVASQKGIPQDQVKTVLKEAGFSGFQPAQWDAYLAALNLVPNGATSE